MFYRKYLKYKLKYLQLKNNSVSPILIGGNINLNKNFNEIHHIIYQINNIIKKNEVLHNSEQITQELIEYIKENDLPIDYFQLDLTKNLEEFKIKLTPEYLKNQYKIRNDIYMIDEKNMNEILDKIINIYNIKNELDISNLFNTNILGHNKNNVIIYMVLFRYLIVNNKQLSNKMKLPFLSSLNIKLALSTTNNSDEYIPLIIQLINQYIFLFPIKKIIILSNTINLSLIYTLKENVIDYNPINPPKLIEKYNLKNKIIEYSDGNTKEIIKANYDDLQQIIYTLYQIPPPRQTSNE